MTGLGTGFSWKPSLRSGTTLILIAGDNRGMGTGGSILNVVSAGTNQDGSCLSNTSPSSTPGSPAGGSYPTGGGGYVVCNFSYDYQLHKMFPFFPAGWALQQAIRQAKVRHQIQAQSLGSYLAYSLSLWPLPASFGSSIVGKNGPNVPKRGLLI